MIVFVFGTVVFVVTFVVASIGRLRDHYGYKKEKPVVELDTDKTTKRPEFRPTNKD